MNTTKHVEISQKTLRIVAARAECDTRTAARAALGLPIKGAFLRERLFAELRKEGIEPPLMTTADDLEAQRPARAASGGS